MKFRLRPFAFDGVAVAAEQLEVEVVVGAAAGAGDDVIHVEVLRPLEVDVAAVAAAYLQAVEHLLVGARRPSATALKQMRRNVGSPLANVLDWRDLGYLAYEDACQLKSRTLNPL